MLILTRKVGQTIIIGDKQVEIVITKIVGSKVRIGINASKDVKIVRKD